MNAVSDVVANRPAPLRMFDQIYMRSADMLIQAEHISRWLSGKRVVFIGDGDALALTVVHLKGTGSLKGGPESVHVLDFDERVVNSVRRFAERYGYTKTVTSELYNVAEGLPPHLIGGFDAFYTNPPYGGSNGGNSVKSFIRRGLEATSKPGALGCTVLADAPEYHWTTLVLREVQTYVLGKGQLIREMIPKFHKYHLDDTPELTSCSLVTEQVESMKDEESQNLNRAELADFYGKDNPLKVRYVRDLTNGGKFASKDFECEAFRDGEL
ncbi:bis-aminopropyl spermidine synthase family protein [Nannocystis punicea]|uniref:Bis-aminopropyl spermidine synthase family protein n=1 Tax=Nannocystis punicea TaxID=2995304 RepID=A0ABY7HAS0_9BACT|nr:bis-aminopropyl spermidine synthase family protein [Nannocystis poenicansa]WAS96390.1 bis-aminopropyl spermidine synthase family protein [Nannocystis poenicansa]